MAKASAFITLLEKNGLDDSRAIANVSPVPFTENNLADWLVRMEITNTGVSKTNNGSLTLRIDELGTFIRSGPILIDEATKNTYLIEMQIKQDINNDGSFGSGVFHPTDNPNGEGSIVLRAIIGQPQIRIDQSFGEILQLQLTGIEYALKEMVTSEWHLFQTPNESFQNRLDEIDFYGSLRSQGSQNFLPTEPQLSFKLNEPTKIHDTFTDIIDQLSLPDVAGGSFNDYYFDVDPDPSNTNYIAVTAEVFGQQDSGVIIDPLSVNVADTGEEETVVTDNISYKNHVILIGSSTGGSMPTERSRFASNYEHGRTRAEWDSAHGLYVVGDLVRYITPTTYNPHLITYHRCISSHTAQASLNPIDFHNVLWESDFTTIPPYITTSATFYRQGEIVSQISGSDVEFYQCNTSGTYGTGLILSGSSVFTFIDEVSITGYTPFVSYSPWTNDVDLWKDQLAGRGFQPSQSEGWAFDWNITKANYNRSDPDSHYETITPKVITGFRSSQPSNVSREYYDGQRFVLNNGASGSEWSGQQKRLAELDGSGVNGEWRFSLLPDDTSLVCSLEDGKIFKYFEGSGLWGEQWSGTDIDNTDKPSPFHLCSNVGLVAGATGIAGQAVQFTYNWAVNTLDLGNTHQFRTSRGAWISSSFPLPRLDTANFNTGELWGGNGTSTPPRGTLDTNNFDRSRKGFIGWNNGIDDEDYGKLSALVFKMRVGMFTNSALDDLAEGQPDVPMIAWFSDKFDRIWYTKFKLRRNGQWDIVRIPIGDLAQNNLYFARWDELAKLNDVPLTFLDYTISQKEFSGVQFDWRFVKHWGCFMQESYLDVGLYKNGLERAFEFGEDIQADLSANWYWYMSGIGGAIIRSQLQKNTPVTQNYIRLGTKIAIDDLHFEKEQIVTSNDTPVVFPRTAVEHLSSENDYLNLKQRAIANQARKRFFPQIWHIRSTGDIRLRFGYRFKVAGSRVPDSPQEMVISQVKHIYDHDGYHTEIAGFRKFFTSG
jgi:hypothetical protein